MSDQEWIRYPYFSNWILIIFNFGFSFKETCGIILERQWRILPEFIMSLDNEDIFLMLKRLKWIKGYHCYSPFKGINPNQILLSFCPFYVLPSPKNILWNMFNLILLSVKLWTHKFSMISRWHILYSFSRNLQFMWTTFHSFH